MGFLHFFPARASFLFEVNMRKIILTNYQCPGDIVMLSGSIRDLFTTGDYVIDVHSSAPDVFANNPYLTSLYDTDDNGQMINVDKDAKIIRIGYPLIHSSTASPYHFSEGFTEELERILDVKILKRKAHGDIHVSDDDKTLAIQEKYKWFNKAGVDPSKPYWIIDAGYKHDFTNKFWGQTKFQMLVKHMPDIQFVQIGHRDHHHTGLEGVVNLIGQTNIRQLIRLVYGSVGVLTPISLPMVLASAVPFDHPHYNYRPCVVIAGAREPSGWQAFGTHQFIHFCGQLPCAKDGGCYKAKSKPLRRGGSMDDSLCYNVTKDDYDDEVPFCMHMISVGDVKRRIEMCTQFWTDKRYRYTYGVPK